MDKSNDPLIVFGHAVRTRRESLGLSQEALADLARVHRTYIGGIERGERNPTLKTMLKLSEALETRLSDLIDLMERIGEA